MSPLLAALLIAQATIYSWTDKDGVEHFTDDLSAVPKGVKVRTTDGAEVSRIDGQVKPVRAAVLTTTTTIQGPPAEPQPSMPSQSEQYWRASFRNLRERIEELEGDVESDRLIIEGNHGLPQTARFSCYPGAWWTSGSTVSVNGQPLPGGGVTGGPGGAVFAPCFHNPEYERIRDRLDRNRRALTRAREDLADLERRASFEAVPLHWRR